MIFITTFTKEIYNFCGEKLLQSFIETGNSELHHLFVFFENEDDLYTENYPDWLVRWANEESMTFINLMNYDVSGIKIIDLVDKHLSHKINHVNEYSSPRSVKWFRPVAAIHYASYLIDEAFCSIDADCIFTSKVTNEYFKDLMMDYNVTFLGRENFNVMRHGTYDQNGNYIHTNTVPATNSDRHTETGFIGFNLSMPGTRKFIERNFNYWVGEDILNLEFKTDCHTFDATRKELDLKYNNLCEPMGEVSPVGSRVIEASVLGEFLTHHKGTIGPNLYRKGKI
jgi:hypothetical protein